VLIFVSEIFYSLQGEGRYAGRPSVFVRFGGCNLRCEGFGGKCDSYYAVDGSFRDEWNKYNASELIAEYSKAKKHDYADTVLTGGEPTLWFKDADFMTFAEHAYQNSSLVTVETNGTKLVDFDFEPYADFVYAISLKLSNSGEKIEDRLCVDAIEAYVKNAKHFFKFVLDADFVSSGNAKAEIDYLVQKFGISAQNIYCMPLGASRDELSKNAKSVFEFCAAEGYSYSDRLHIRVFDKKKGV
jgi:7-carboxy-7-deazaguanine synthase